jgi:DNA-binding LytR/AlgR family response regulator
VFYRAQSRLPSFWLLQTIGCCCFGLTSVLLVAPYIRQPWELGYSNLESLFTDQMVMCLGVFFASLALRPICRSLLQRSLPWFPLQLRALGWSLLVGTLAALVVSRLIIATPDPIEDLEACVKASALLFLWCNLYFSIKHSQRQSPVEVSHQPTLPLQSEAYTPTSRASDEGKPYNYATLFSVRTGSRVQIISVNDVEWIAAAGDYSELHTCAGTHLLRETMKSLEQRLDPARFVRIHRSRIVCLPLILELRSMENREYVVKLSDGSQHRCSRTYAPRIDSWLRNSK